MKTALSMCMCCAQATGHMVDPSHGIGDIVKAHAPQILMESQFFSKKSRKQTVGYRLSAGVKADGLL